MSDDKLQIQEAQKNTNNTKNTKSRIKHKLKENPLYWVGQGSIKPLDYTVKLCIEITLIKSYRSTLTSVCSNYRKLMVNTK